ncbi:hypothetical protein [Pantoea sp. GABEPS69]|uniref:hypothetical protein n=1 Tax=Pantoea sp. GABEPS69 TaxID=3028805 RepID=UPI003891316E
MDASIIKQRFINLKVSTDITVPKESTVNVFSVLSLSDTQALVIQNKSGVTVLISDDLTKGSIEVLDEIKITCTSLVLHNLTHRDAVLNISITG